jgi:hypothetical protein
LPTPWLPPSPTENQAAAGLSCTHSNVRRATYIRRRVGLAAILAVVALAIVAIGHSSGGHVTLCLGGPARLAGVWESAESALEPPLRRTAVERAFMMTGVRTAGDVLNRVEANLDRYRTKWLTIYQEACEATVHKEQSSALLDLRMACLNDRLRALSALTNVLMTADGEVVRHAVDAANLLPPIEACADRKQLEAPREAPRDGATRERVEDLRTQLATAKAQNDAGKHSEAAAQVKALLVEARATGYRTLVAETLRGLSRCFYSATYTPDILTVMEEAMWTALASGRDDLAAEAIIELAGRTTRAAKFDEGWA